MPQLVNILFLIVPNLRERRSRVKVGRLPMENGFQWTGVSVFISRQQAS